MKIQIKEIGAIKEATIDLNKKLNVFCGANGTGKTYLSYIIYAITRPKNRSIGKKLGENVIKELFENNLSSFTIDSLDIYDYRKQEIELLKKNLWSIFAVSESKAVDFFGKTDIKILESPSEFHSRILALSFEEVLNIYNLPIKIKKLSDSLEITISIDKSFIKNEGSFNILEIVFLSRLFTFLAFYPLYSSTILPVERNSIYTFSNELSLRRNEAYDYIQSMANNKELNVIDLFFKRATRYPQAIKDCLETAEELDSIQKRNSPYYEFATDIENELLNGKVKIDKEGNVEFTTNKALRKKLSFHQSSSIVKTLSSLVIYLKHIAVKNDLIIIDEPELNLHPENQVKLARIFARLINAGLRILISTHSDYIIRELNNLIMISSDNLQVKNSAIEFGYKKDEYINVDEIGAHLFTYKNSKSKQTTVTPIAIDANGFEVKTFDDTIEELNNVSDKLFYLLNYEDDSKLK